MTTASGAYDVVKARIEANITAVPVRWQNEDSLLPDTPSAFLYVEFLTDPASLVSFGGGRGANRYRNPARIDAYAFVPNGQGLRPATDLAETVAALFRSYRDNDISCFDATVYPGGDGATIKPPGLSSEVGNYFWAVAEISLHFDLLG